MAAIKIILLLAITMALSITLVTVKRVGTHDQEEEDTWPNQEQQPMKDNNLVLPSQRVSRFLAETKNPRAADHCHKDNDKCASVPAAEGGGKNTTCCNNKCMDLSEDKHNCGACKKKCKYTQECCRGQCVDTDYDKRHCGGCNHRCKVGQYCVYGLCDYA